MLRHTTRSLARLSLRAGRQISASASLRAPDLEPGPSTSARPAGILFDGARPGTDIAGEAIHRSSQIQTSTDVKWHKVNELYEWDWFRDPLYKDADQPGGIPWTQYTSKVRNIRSHKEAYDVAWLNEHHEVARTYRIARARLWTPRDVTLSEKEIRTATELRFNWLRSLLREAQSRMAAALLDQSQGKQSGSTDLEIRRLKAIIRHTEDRLSAFQWAGTERAIDDLYKEHWIKLTDEQRRGEMLRLRYECARRLGWRKGYTSGYPTDLPADDREAEIEYARRRELREALGSKKPAEASAAVERLLQAEEVAAWEAWVSMDKTTRREEEKAAWDLRDRSLIYTDESAHILDKPEPRWYSQPQKVGSMVFLPNVIVRLVRNTVTRHGGPDPFKATFRVPLSMHKHSLRSYLLAIYGLRTTWCRSSIYRAPIVRNAFGRKSVGSSNRTFKKVEVGILEPFLFPEITSRFQQEHMRRGEMKLLQAKTYFKVTGVKRWRGKMPVRKIVTPKYAKGAMLENGVVMRDDDVDEGESKTTASMPSSRRRAVPKTEKPQSLLASGGIVTKKRKRILRLIHKKTLAREKEVAIKVGQLKQQHQEQTL